MNDAREVNRLHCRVECLSEGLRSPLHTIKEMPYRRAANFSITAAHNEQTAGINGAIYCWLCDKLMHYFVVNIVTTPVVYYWFGMALNAPAW